MDNNFKKVHTAKDLTISIIVLLIGTGLFFLNRKLGICVLFCGLGMLILYKDGYKMNGRGAVLTKISEDLCKCCRPSILDFLNEKDIIPQIEKGNKNGSVLIDVYYNDSEHIAYAQLFDFVNYKYEPATELVELHFPKSDMLLSQLK